jgi:hypothetical protein
MFCRGLSVFLLAFASVTALATSGSMTVRTAESWASGDKFTAMSKRRDNGIYRQVWAIKTPTSSTKSALTLGVVQHIGTSAASAGVVFTTTAASSTLEGVQQGTASYNTSQFVAYHPNIVGCYDDGGSFAVFDLSYSGPSTTNTTCSASTDGQTTTCHRNRRWLVSSGTNCGSPSGTWSSEAGGTTFSGYSTGSYEKICVQQDIRIKKRISGTLQLVAQVEEAGPFHSCYCDAFVSGICSTGSSL